MRILIAILGLTVIGPSWAADGIVDQIMDGDTVAFSLDGIDAPENGPATPHKCVPVPFDDRAVGDGSSANRMDGPENGPVRVLKRAGDGIQLSEHTDGGDGPAIYRRLSTGRRFWMSDYIGRKA